jgi:hypothetical protein
VSAPLRPETADAGIPAATHAEPVGVLSLRDCVAFRDRDEDNAPTLLISDGETTIAIECGLRGASPQAAAAAASLAAAVAEYAELMRRRAAAPRVPM